MAITLSEIVNSYTMLKIGVAVYVAAKLREYAQRRVAYPASVTEERPLSSDKPVPKDYVYA